jgi:hypothetical protein
VKLCATVSALLLSLAAGAPGASAQVAWPELILRAAPSPLPAGTTGTVQVQIVAAERLSNAVITATASPSGLTLSPARLVLGRVDPPNNAARMPMLNPSQPALGVVPTRNLRITASQAGTYEVTVSLSYDGGSISQSVAVTAR